MLGILLLLLVLALALYLRTWVPEAIEEEENEA